MAEVVVAGGGVAGIAAAITSSSLGAKVTLVDESETIGKPKSLYHLLLRDEASPGDLKAANPEELKARFGIVTRLKEKAVSVDTKGRVLETSNSRIRYDALVLATGASTVSETIKGMTKKHVYAMRGLSDYFALSQDLVELSSVAILGSAPLSLTLAETLAKRKIKVSIFSISLLYSYLSSSIREIVLEHLRANGVRIVEGGLDNIAGMEKVEAVVSGGSVYPCEAVIVFPRTIPNVPRIDLKMGSSGGVLVDRMMKTSDPRVFAAGDCIELQFGTASFPLRLQSAARVMGEVAGANASGRSEVARISGTLGFVTFGLEFCSAGHTLEDAKKAGFDAREFSWSAAGQDGIFGGQAVSCSLIYDKKSRVLYGVQLAGWRALSYSDLASLVVSMNVRLEDLAHLESSYVPMISRDESPIATTAKKALASAL
jgi:NADPH-dependent 2,4-dienoyl-CoA reductase/sulfur reductase-like enzyme